MAEWETSGNAGKTSNLDADPPKLSELLDRGWRIFEEVDGSDEPLGSTSIQTRVRHGVSLLEEASRMVDQLQLFSSNEELEEVATADLKYLLLPALLGALTMKQTSRDRRLQTVQAARTFFMDFLRRCKDYNVAQFELPIRTSPGEAARHELSTATCVSSSDLVSLAAKRRAKIERYHQKKELESRLADIKRAVNSGQADDEVTRDFYLLNIQRWVTVSLEELEGIEQELEILQMMPVLRPDGGLQPAQPLRPVMKPFILTKDAVQAQVFGAGYPSLPTMTVNDWYDQHRKHGLLPDQGIPRKTAVDASENDEDKEDCAENDESLLKARNWDDWKDNHRRGFGNRHNMG